MFILAFFKIFYPFYVLTKISPRFLLKFTIIKNILKRPKHLVLFSQIFQTLYLT